MTPELEFRGIVKRFSGVIANDHIDLTIEPGSIHAIIGENGAGKTTLMKILYGLYQPDEGEIYVRGQKVEFKSPSDSIRAGLGMVHQQFMLFPLLTVTENVIFGYEPTSHGFIDQKTADQEIKDLSRQYGLEVEPGIPVGQLPVGICQKVEILKTLYRKANILILDEPTAVLTPQEREGLFKIMRNLTAQGKTILFITHKLNEVMEIADNITVLRNGRVTANLRTNATNPVEITRYMVGRDVLLKVDKEPFQGGREVLKVENIQVKNEDGRELIKNISFNVRAGEVVGVAGVTGNGQSELVEAIVGLRSLDHGYIALNDNDISRLSMMERRKTISYIPEDRVKVGTAVDAQVADNLIMGFQWQSPVSHKNLLQKSGINQFTVGLIRQFGIKVSQITEPISNLSGGNMQKAIVARELSHGFPLLIADQPTRGVDIGSIEFIYQQLINYRNQGKAILLISADLNEILTLSDRILVLYEGQIVGEMPAENAQEEVLGLMMTGAWRGSVQVESRAIDSIIDKTEEKIQ
jgi:general nucleoside transport system ATP-binding protein